jgi:uncharacterized LabA/DUF88 family protein
MSKELNRLSIFIDGGHYNAIQRHYQTDFDFPRFLNEVQKRLTEEVGLLSPLHCFYYDCEPYTDINSTPEEKEASSKKRAYFNFLRSQIVRVREGAVAKRTLDNGQTVFQQKKVDLLLGLDIAEECSKRLMSHLALIAGDADLVPAVEFASHKGVQTWLIHGPRNMCSDTLWSTADGRIEIDANFVKKVAR